MSDASSQPHSRESIEQIYRAESRRVFATLVRLLGDLDLAEESLQDAFISALQQWPRSGIPSNPRAWLTAAARFKGIDSIRRRARLDDVLCDLAQQRDGVATPEMPSDGHEIEDDRLRLIFTCCHPALPQESHVPLTLREVCGLTTEEIASAFFVSIPTIAQRIVRAKAKIKAAKIPYQIPSRQDVPERLDGVMHVIYLIFSEGYSASMGPALIRTDLSAEAIRLGRLLVALMPEPEAIGLLALMLLQDSRQAARVSPDGDIILLEDQDRLRWDQQKVAEGLALIERAMASGVAGPYTLQAAIAAVHAQAQAAADTDWPQIVALYELLLRAAPSPFIELNRAVAIAMRDGPAAGLLLIDAILARGELGDYHRIHAARGELYRRAGNFEAARESFARALQLAQLAPERRFIQDRLSRLEIPGV